MNSPMNPEVPGKPGIGEREQHHEGRELRHGIDHAAVGAESRGYARGRTSRPTHRNIAPETRPCESICTTAPSRPSSMPLVLAGVRHDLKADEHAERDEAHVRDRRIGDQLLHVALRQRDEADVHHGDQRQRNDQPIQFAAGIRARSAGRIAGSRTRPSSA